MSADLLNVLTKQLIEEVGYRMEQRDKRIDELMAYQDRLLAEGVQQENRIKRLEKQVADQKAELSRVPARYLGGSWSDGYSKGYTAGRCDAGQPVKANTDTSYDVGYLAGHADALVAAMPSTDAYKKGFEAGEMHAGVMARVNFLMSGDTYDKGYHAGLKSRHKEIAELMDKLETVEQKCAAAEVKLLLIERGEETGAGT